MEILPQLYFIMFLIGPAYFLLIFLVGQFAGDGFEGGLEDIDDIDVDFDVSIDLDVDIDLSVEDLGAFDEGVAIDSEVSVGDDNLEFDEVTDYHFQVKYFSPRIWTLIISGFGGGGYVSITYLGVTILSSLLIGCLTGLLIGSFLFAILRYLYTHSIINDLPLKLEGGLARVTLPIPQKGVGLVEVGFSAGNQEYRARSVHRRTVFKGETVFIMKHDVPNHLVIVKVKK